MKNITIKPIASIKEAMDAPDSEFSEDIKW